MRAAAAKAPQPADPRLAGPPPVPGAPPAPVAPAGWAIMMSPAPPAVLGPGALVRYWWPDYGLQRGVVARLCKRAPYSHVRYAIADPLRPLRLTWRRCGSTRRPLLRPPLGVARSLRRSPGPVSMLPSLFSRPAGAGQPGAWMSRSQHVKRHRCSGTVTSLTQSSQSSAAGHQAVGLRRHL